MIAAALLLAFLLGWLCGHARDLDTPLRRDAMTDWSTVTRHGDAATAHCNESLIADVRAARQSLGLLTERHAFPVLRGGASW